MDRFFVGVTLATASMLGVNTEPLMNKTLEVQYPTHYESQQQCEEQLKTIKKNHNITTLVCSRSG